MGGAARSVGGGGGNPFKAMKQQAKIERELAEKTSVDGEAGGESSEIAQIVAKQVHEATKRKSDSAFYDKVLKFLQSRVLIIG